MTLVEGPCLKTNPFFRNEREFLHFTSGPTDENNSLWLGEVDANGDQTVYVNWYEWEILEGETHDFSFTVYISAGHSLIESDFLFSL